MYAKKKKFLKKLVIVSTHIIYLFLSPQTTNRNRSFPFIQEKKNQFQTSAQPLQKPKKKKFKNAHPLPMSSCAQIYLHPRTSTS